MDPFNAAVLKYLSEIGAEIKKIKTDISAINESIKQVKEEHDVFMKAFPNGIEKHRSDHTKKKNWFF